MSAKSKLTLLLELKDKLFNKKLQKVKANFNKTTNKMRGNIDKLKMSTLNGFKAMREEIPMFGRAMSLLGNPYALLIVGLLAVGVMYAKATKAAIKFDNEFLQIKNLNLDKTNKDLKTYKWVVMDTAFQTGRSLTESAQGFYDIQSALGTYGKDAKKIFTEVANFSTATGAELGSSINATTKAMKAFNLEAGDTKMLLESNAKTVQVGITNFKELAQVQTEYAGAAAGAGQSVDSANKLFAAFTSIAKDSRTAATMTKTAFMGLTQEATIKGLKSIGIGIYDANGNMRDLDKILREVNTKFKKMSPKQIDELINKIGGPEGLRALFTKLKTGADDLFKTFDAFDASKFDLNQALKNAKGDVTILSGIISNQFNAIMTRLGEKTLPMVAKALGVVNTLLDFLWKHWDNVATITKKVGGILMPVLAIFTGLYHIWNKSKAIIFGLTEGISVFFSNFKDNAITIISGVGEMFVGLGKIIKGVLFFNPANITEGVTQLKKGFHNIKSTGKDALDAYKNKMHQQQREAAAKIWEEKTKGNSLLINKTKEDDDNNTTNNDINSVTQKASQPRSIVINIEALNKGGINTSNTTLAHKSPEDIEEWFNEMMMRVVRGVELSHG